MGNENEQMKIKFTQSAVKLDAVEPPTPDFLFFKDMVGKQQAALRCAQKLQFALFTAVAAMLMAALIVCLGRFLFFVVALQGLAIAIAAGALAAFFLRNRRQHAGARS
jgi:hypothetical protein